MRKSQKCEPIVQSEVYNLKLEPGRGAYSFLNGGRKRGSLAEPFPPKAGGSENSLGETEKSMWGKWKKANTTSTVVGSRHGAKLGIL